MKTIITNTNRGGIIILPLVLTENTNSSKISEENVSMNLYQREFDYYEYYMKDPDIKNYKRDINLSK